MIYQFTKNDTVTDDYISYSKKKHDLSSWFKNKSYLGMQLIRSVYFKKFVSHTAVLSDILWHIHITHMIFLQCSNICSEISIGIFQE